MIEYNVEVDGSAGIYYVATRLTGRLKTIVSPKPLEEGDMVFIRNPDNKDRAYKFLITDTWYSHERFGTYLRLVPLPEDDAIEVEVGQLNEEE